MKKKLISMFLVLAVFLTLPVSIYANNTAESTNPISPIQNKIAQHTKAILDFMEPEKELYGLSNVDFTELYLGEKIPAYFYTDSGFIQSEEIQYYPIMYQNEWVATAYVLTHSDGSINVQITTDFAEDYQASNVESNKISLIFDASCTYLLAGEEFIRVATSAEKNSDRADLNTSDLHSLPESSQLTSTIKISAPHAATPYASFDNQKYLSVPLIKQSAGSMECWAACIASIRGYYGTNTTIADVYKKAGKTKGTGATLVESDKVLKSYGFKTKEYNDSNLNWYQLRTEIYSFERPIFAACSIKTTIGHAVVVRGYYCNTNAAGLGILGYMDPDTGKYGASSVEKDYYFYYMPNGGGKYRMVSFLSVYK